MQAISTFYESDSIIEGINGSTEIYNELLLDSDSYIAILSEDGKIMKVNEKFASWVNKSNPSLSGLSSLHLEGLPFLQWVKLCDSVIYHSDFKKMKEEIGKVLNDNLHQAELVCRIFGRKSMIRWFRCTFSIKTSKSGDQKYLVFEGKDITEEKNISETLSFSNRHDQLTGYLTQEAYKKELDEMLTSKSKGLKSQLSVVYLNLDDFGFAEKCLGDEDTDCLLKRLSIRLNSIYSNEVRGRINKHSFGFISKNNVSDTIELAEKTRERLKKPFYINGKEIFVTASIGIANSDLSPMDAEDLFDCSFNAMEKAKELGKDCYSLLCDKPKGMEDDQTFYWISDLKRAIENEEFALRYQPIVDLTTNKTKGFEALITWNHPQKGKISPVKFIPLAEKIGLMHKIDKWVVKTAVKQLKEWQDLNADNKNWTMNINVSPVCFNTIDIADELEKILDEYKVDSKNIILEITETATINHFSKTLKILGKLKKLGVKIALDDFGTGYSSLSYLHSLPISIVKIDRSFVKTVSKKRGYSKILDSIINLTKTIGVKIVAEGIETDLQCEYLKDAQCDYGQGYLFSKPKSGNEITKSILSKPTSDKRRTIKNLYEFDLIQPVTRPACFAARA